MFVFIIFERHRAALLSILWGLKIVCMRRSSEPRGLNTYGFAGYLFTKCWKLNRRYLDKSSRPKTKAVIQEELIRKKAKSLVENDQSGATTLMTSSSLDDLSRMSSSFLWWQNDARTWFCTFTFLGIVCWLESLILSSLCAVRWKF